MNSNWVRSLSSDFTSKGLERMKPQSHCFLWRSVIAEAVGLLADWKMKQSTAKREGAACTPAAPRDILVDGTGNCTELLCGQLSHRVQECAGWVKLAPQRDSH